MDSMMMEITTNTKQTTATAHVGVSCKERPDPPPAILLSQETPYLEIQRKQATNQVNGGIERKD